MRGWQTTNDKSLVALCFRRAGPGRNDVSGRKPGMIGGSVSEALLDISNIATYCVGRAGRLVE